MKDTDRPLALGYIRQHLLMTEYELDDAKERLAYFAETQGYALDTIYVEELHTWPAAFEQLVQDAAKDRIEIVILPSLLHFAVIGPPDNIKQHFEDATGARVIAALSVAQ
jgi:hypothetical protein